MLGSDCTKSTSEAGVTFEAVQGFDPIAYSDWEVVQAIASGKADAGVSNAAIALLI